MEYSLVEQALIGLFIFMLSSVCLLIGCLSLRIFVELLRDFFNK